MSELVTHVDVTSDLYQHRIESLPIVVLHVHSRCNCRCAMCDIWRTRHTEELLAEDLDRMLPSFESLGVRWVVLTGGEPLLHSNLASICNPLRDRGIKITILTTGLLLARYSEIASELFDEIIISVDGPASIHDRIRGVNGAFQTIERGIASVRDKSPGVPLRARTTVQKANHIHLRETVESVKALQLDSISFLAADLTSTAFNRELVWPVARQNEIGLTIGETLAVEQEIEKLISEYEREIDSGFIVESAAKLRRIVQHFRVHLGLESASAPVCNAPWRSAVIELDGSVRPCFFQPAIGTLASQCLQDAINDSAALPFRANLDIANNPICKRCVCSLNFREG